MDNLSHPSWRLSPSGSTPSLRATDRIGLTFPQVSTKSNATSQHHLLPRGGGEWRNWQATGKQRGRGQAPANRSCFTGGRTSSSTTCNTYDDRCVEYTFPLRLLHFGGEVNRLIAFSATCEFSIKLSIFNERFTGSNFKITLKIVSPNLLESISLATLASRGGSLLQTLLRVGFSANISHFPFCHVRVSLPSSPSPPGFLPAQPSWGSFGVRSSFKI